MKKLIIAIAFTVLSLSAHSKMITGDQLNCPEQDKYRDAITDRVIQAYNGNQLSVNGLSVLISALSNKPSILLK